MIKDFNTANENKDVNLKCWPIFQNSDDSWMVLVITDAHDKLADAKDNCRIRIDGTSSWLEATRLKNPVTSIQVEDTEHRVFATYRVKVPASPNNGKQPHWTPLEMTRDTKDGSLAPVFSRAKMLRANLRLTATSTPELLDQIKCKWVPEATRSFQDPKHYHDIYRWGAEQEFEFEAAAVREFNRTSVFQCWLILCHPREDELYQADPDDMLLQECLVVVETPGLQEGFPKVGDLCDIAVGREMPALNKDAKDTKDNLMLKRREVKYFRATRLENASELFSLDKQSVKGSSWKRYSTFKVVVHRKPVDDSSDYTPFQGFECKLDRSNISRQDGGSRPQIILDKKSSFKAHIWVDISTTTLNVELNALETAMSEPPESRVGKALSYIRTFSNKTENCNLFQQVFPHMNPHDPDSVLPDNLRALFQRLDHDQKEVYRSVLSSLPARVGLFLGGPSTGKTTLVLTICALALASYVPRDRMRHAMDEKVSSAGGPILLIVDGNRGANMAATRVVKQFEALGRNDLCIVRAYNFNYEGKWATRRYLKPDHNNDTPEGFDFDECFPAQRADHIPQIRRGLRTDCLALTLREKAQQYLAEHPDDFPLTSELLIITDPKKIKSDDNRNAEKYRAEWDALLVAVLDRTDFVVTTPVGAAKIAQYFHPKLVLFDSAARARELSTLVAISNFPSAEAFLFTGTPEMTKPFVASSGNPKLWNPCVEQLRTSMVERYSNFSPDTQGLSLNHQACGNLHALSSHVFFDGQLQSALPSSERFPPSTIHLLEYVRNLSKNPSLAVPRLVVNVEGSEAVDQDDNSKLNDTHRNWVLRRVVRDLLQDGQFRSTDGREPGSIIVTAPYKAQVLSYRKEIHDLLRRLDREHRAAGGIGEKLHRQILVDAMTVDTCEGHSADVVIYDLVNSKLTSHIADPNRLCVALTRAIQCEIIVMEKSLMGLEGPSEFFNQSHLGLLYEHCKSQGQVIEVNMVDDSSIQKGYTLHRTDARVGQDVSAVPRTLPALPATSDTPRQQQRPNAVPDAAERGKWALDSDGDDEDGGTTRLLGEDFGYVMATKLMNSGYKWPAGADGDL